MNNNITVNNFPSMKEQIFQKLNIRSFYGGYIKDISSKDQNYCRCPFPDHDDSNPSFSVNLLNGFYKCHGCGNEGDVFDFYKKYHGVDFKTAVSQLAELIGIDPENNNSEFDKILYEYDYLDNNGNLLYQIVRYNPKEFRPRRKDKAGNWVYNLPGVEKVLYNLPELVKSENIIYVEGEKDADNLKKRGFTATTHPFGANSWKSDYSKFLKGKNVFIIPDNDTSGFKLAYEIAKDLLEVAQTVKIIQLPDLGEQKDKNGLDVTDWIEKRRVDNKSDGDIKMEINHLIEKAPIFKMSFIQGPDNIAPVTIKELLIHKFPPREDILEPWLQTQGLAMIHAFRGVGKTQLSVGIAVAVSSGSQFLKWKAEKPRKVLFIDGEMPGAVIQERFSNALWSMEKEPIESFLRIVTPDLIGSSVPNLSDEINQNKIEPYLKDISLIIIDNLSTVCQGGPENDAQSWLSMQNWALKQRSEGKSILFIHHDGKSGTQRGTSRKEDALDTVIALKRPKDYEPEKGACFEIHFEKSRCIHGEDVKPFEVSLSVEKESRKSQWIIKDIEESLTEQVAELLNQNMRQTEIAKILDVVPGTVSKHKKKAKEKGLIK